MILATTSGIKEFVVPEPTLLILIGKGVGMKFHGLFESFPPPCTHGQPRNAWMMPENSGGINSE